MGLASAGTNRVSILSMTTSYGKQLRQLWQKQTIALPGVFNPLVGMSAKQVGFKALYFSGGAFSATLGLPDIGLFTLTELADQVQKIIAATDLPILVDADTGFGEAINVARTVETLKAIGAAGIHLEDQVMPKRCGHLDGKELVSTEKMCEKIRAAVAARKDSDFILMARTDARATSGMEGALKRAKAYLKAGADALFPEGLQSAEEFKIFAKNFPKTPLLANMTEFGKTPFISVDEFAKIGFKAVIFPVTCLRLAMQTIEKGLIEIRDNGTQKKLVADMQTRQELYKLLNYRIKL